MGSVLLAVISELQAFNFHDTFTDPFEVGLLQSWCSRSCSICCGSWGIGLDNALCDRPGS